MVERLLREARAQARIDHPGVCKVYEVGTDDGRPYIAMEYVDGRLLDDAARDMTTEQKVLVVKRVAAAIQAAHAQGLIHRDLKPSNIMVAESEDGELAPYVLDFGIAREQEARGLTVTGQVLGTPGYLSPEQARGELDTLDRRTDIFSLGVVLYEILAGRRPLEGDSNVEILVSLLENDPPSLRRKVASLSRDLDTIVMRCLEKDPDRRYPSARALAEDLGRSLAGEPVAAARVGTVERIVRQARKHPWTAGAVVVAAVAVLALAVVAVGGWIKYTVDLKRERNAALEAQAVAEAKEHEAREVTDFLVDVFRTSEPDESHGEEVTAREILDRDVASIGIRLGERPEIRARLLGIMGGVFVHLGLHDRALPLLEQALQQILDLPDHDVASEIEAQVRLADLCRTVGDLDRAADLIGVLPSLIDSSPDLDPAVAAQGLGCVGRVQIDQGDFEAATTAFDRALTIAQRGLGADAPLVGDLLNDLSYISCRQKRWDRAIAEASRALEILEKAYGADNPRVATTLNSLALALRGADRLEESAAAMERVLAIRERTLGPDHPRASVALNNLGLVYQRTGELDRAEELFDRALSIRMKIYGEEHPDVARVLNNLAGVDRDRGELDRAEATYLKSIAIIEKVLGPDHPELAFSLSGISRINLMRGNHAQVVEQVARILAIREAAFGRDSPNLVGTLRALGESHLALGNIDEAGDVLGRARRIAVAAYGEDNPRVVDLDAALARAGAAAAAGDQD